MSHWTKDRDRARVYDHQIELGWRKVFGSQVVGFEPTADGSAEQRAEVDRYVVMRDGRRIPVEEKVRFRPFTDDLLLELEHVHDDGRREPGWINRRMDCEYLGCMWVPSMAFVVVPSQMLKAYWDDVVQNHQIQSHQLIWARNDTYRTRCAIVNLHRIPCGVFNMLETERWK